MSTQAHVKYLMDILDRFICFCCYCRFHFISTLIIISTELYVVAIDFEGHIIELLGVKRNKLLGVVVDML